MKIISYIFILQYLLSVAFAQDVGIKEKKVSVVLGIDKITKLNFAPSTKVQVGNESVLTYQLIPQKREVTFKGLKPGETSVIIRNTIGDIKARYLVKVTASSQSKNVQELRKLLEGVEGLEIGIKGDKAYVGGQIVVPGDIGKVVVIMNMDQYRDVLQLVELSPHTQRIIARKMQDEIQANGLKNVTVRIVNKRFWLEGVVSSDGKKKRAQDIAVAYLPDNIESLARRKQAVQTVDTGGPIRNFINVNAKSKPKPVPKLVKVTAQFVELKKTYRKVFGFKWTPLRAGDGGSISFGKTNAGGVSATSDNTLSATISQLFPKLASAKSAGHARVIQSGVIIVKDKVAGNITKESTVNYQLGGGDNAQPSQSTAGFKVGVTPTILSGDKVELKLNIGVSVNIGMPPQKSNNSIKTELVVKSKESAVVGGIVSNETSTDFDKDGPFKPEDADGGTPLFSFLRTKDYNTSRSQFVIFVTPEIIESASEGSAEIKKKFRRRRR